MHTLQAIIEKAYEERASLSPARVSTEIKQAVHEAIALLDSGKARVAEKLANNAWHTHQWLKKAVLLFFRLHDSAVIPGTFTQYFDKVPVKFAHDSAQAMAAAGVRVVPPAVARQGAYIAP
ncbi:MAG TPA: 2,3,4,5-tetrahydropyridine-2,6-dicarboxylate N-succinyltransferase, partial [Gammaproteobacteria bacterium]|nr:2,3,4,5-tetrahydropyridine-2,6-dicarboxylate N-succinyltransferase [Gammaproteobacteria bacterium]